MKDAALRANVAELLKGGHAHVDVRKALQGLEPRLRSRRPEGDPHSVWELLEHLRLSQEDILRYTLDPKWKSPEWPEGYWPPPVESVSDTDWEKSVSGFLSDLAELIEVARDPKIELTAEIPHGEGRTYLRELLLAADHNAYHLGQIVQARRLLGAWKG